MALVASGAALSGVPATAATPTAANAGITAITFDPSFASVYRDIRAISPSRKSQAKITFPIESVSGGNRVFHRGGMYIGNGIAWIDPIISLTRADLGQMRFVPDNEDFPNRTPILIFTMRNLTVQSDTALEQVWVGDLHMTRDRTTIEMLNTWLVGYGNRGPLTRGMYVGQIRMAIRK